MAKTRMANREAYVDVHKMSMMIHDVLIHSRGIDMLNVLDMLSSFSDVRVPWRFLSSFHSGSSIKESDQERQRNAEQVEDLRKQLSTAAAEACLHWPALAMSHCLGRIARQR